MTLDYGNYGIFGFMRNAGYIFLNPKPQNPIDPLLKAALKGTLIDPFKGTLGFISSTRTLGSPFGNGRETRSGIKGLVLLRIRVSGSSVTV